MAEQPANGRRAPVSVFERPPGGVHSLPTGLEPPSLRDSWAVVRRHLRLTTGVMAVVIAVAAYVAYVTPPLYRATSVVRLVDARRALEGGLVDPSADADLTLPSASPVLSQVEVLRSRATAGAVVDDMPVLRIAARHFPVALVRDVQLDRSGMSADSIQLQFGPQTVRVEEEPEPREIAYGTPIEVHGLRFTIAEPPTHGSGTLYVVRRDDAIGALTNGLLVKPRENTDVIDIVFIASDPGRAQAVANRMAQVFQAGNARLAQQEARRRREFIETQLRFNDSVLADARRALSTFRTGESRSVAERSAGAGNGAPLAERRAELEMERRQYAGVLERLRDTSSAMRRAVLGNAIAASATIGGNPVVARLYDQLVQYENVRDSLTTGDWARAAANPDVQRLRPLIVSTEARLAGVVQSVVASLDARIGVLKDLEARGLATARLLSSAQATEDLLGEQVENARRVADQLRVEYQKARIAEAVQAGHVEIVDLAPLPNRPIGVGGARILVFGVLLGVLVGGGSAFLADYFNTSVHRREDVVQLGLPVLGIVPHSKGASTDAAAPIIEAMRGIRFNVLHSYGTAGPVMFTTTSPGNREGKSFVASNLALAFADAGLKTLLIDGDVRRGSLYRIFNTRRKPGLTDVLHGETSSENAIQTTPYPLLYFVGTGTRTPDAPELLASEAMVKFVAGVKQNFGVVIADSPPLGAGVDAYVLGAVTGNLLMVFRLGITNREAAEAKLDLLDRLPVRLLGTVLNDVTAHSPYATYSYYMEGYAYETDHGRQRRTLAGHQAATADRARS